MPEILDTDPGKGFVAFPMSVFELDLTPGAFRTLAELCRMANTEGKCWPSLRQLGDRLGRSRAAVSGYIAELRESGLIETETQKMANGYNYRLRYCVVFWKEWRAQLGQQPERSVQPSVRPLKTQNQSHSNQSPAIAVKDDLVAEWKVCVGRAQYPGFDVWPSELLLKKSETASEISANISVDIIARYRSFLTAKGIVVATQDAEIQSLLRAKVQDQATANSFLEALDAHWKPHWRKPPTLPQLKRLMPRNGPQARAKLLASFLKRWETHCRTLSLSDKPGRVAA